MDNLLTGAAVTRWNYHPVRGWLTSKLYDNGIGTSYDYTPAGRLYRKFSPRSITNTYSYGASGELTSIDYSDDTTDVALYYDRVGRVERVERGSNTNFYRYADGGLLVEESFGGSLLGGLAITNGYDSAGRRFSLSLSNHSATALRYVYDAWGRLLRITNGTRMSLLITLTNRCWLMR